MRDVYPLRRRFDSRQPVRPLPLLAFSSCAAPALKTRCCCARGLSSGRAQHIDAYNIHRLSRRSSNARHATKQVRPKNIRDTSQAANHIGRVEPGTTAVRRSRRPTAGTAVAGRGRAPINARVRSGRVARRRQRFQPCPFRAVKRLVRPLFLTPRKCLDSSGCLVARRDHSATAPLYGARPSWRRRQELNPSEQFGGLDASSSQA